MIPESPFYLEGKGGLFEYIEKTLKENGHMVIVVAEGAGQDLIAESMKSMEHEDASGNKLLLDVGLWLSQRIKVRYKFKSQPLPIYRMFCLETCPFYVHHVLDMHIYQHFKNVLVGFELSMMYSYLRMCY